MCVFLVLGCIDIINLLPSTFSRKIRDIHFLSLEVLSPSRDFMSYSGPVYHVYLKLC